MENCEELRNHNKIVSKSRLRFDSNQREKCQPPHSSQCASSELFPHSELLSLAMDAMLFGVSLAFRMESVEEKVEHTIEISLPRFVLNSNS